LIKNPLKEFDYQHVFDSAQSVKYYEDKKLN